MKILVVDDNPQHLEAAKAQLSEHDVTTASSYDEAMQTMFVVLGSHNEKIERTRQQFDAVLVDLLMPASAAMQSHPGKSGAGQEMPVGIFLALLAAKSGAKYVGLLTDTSHHGHPASSCLDAFNEGERKPTRFTVGEATVLLTNNRSWVNVYERGGDPSKPVDEGALYASLKDKSEGYYEEHYYRAKSWDLLLAYLLNA